ncbi:MAG: multiheme c-type cytochrome, partial [Ignavibacteria bacterium]|nr:multiheme c-type cytochrome [Ignavibacteria bacterium]
MKYIFNFAVVLFLSPLFFIQAQNGHTYIGAEACSMCHKTEKQGSQYSIWQNSAHSKAFET